MKKYIFYFASVFLILANGTMAQKASFPESETQKNVRLKANELAEVGNALLKAGQSGDAEAQFRGSLATGFETPAAQRGLAEALAGQGKKIEAIKAYRDLIYTDAMRFSSLASEPMVLMKYSILLTEVGQWDEAVSVYEYALPLLHLGNALPEINIHFDTRVRNIPQLQSAAQIVIGVVHSKRNEAGEAVKNYAEATRLQPNLALAQFYFGYGLKGAGRIQEAKTAFGKAANLGQGKIKIAAQEMLR